MRTCILSALSLALALAFSARCAGDEKEDAKRLKALVADLHNKDAQVRHGASRILADMGKAARPAVPALMQLLHDKEASLRVDGAMAIKAIGLTAQDIPGLLQALKDFERGEGFEVLRPLVGVLSPDMIGPLTKALRDDRRGVRLWAALVLEELGPEAASAAAGLVEATGDKDAGVRIQALDSLWKTGARAALLTPILTKALKDNDVLVRVKAADFLAQLDPANKAAIPVLIAAATGKGDRPKDVEARERAVRIFGELRERAKPAVDALIDIVKQTDNEDSLRADVIFSLGSIGVGARAAVPVLLAAAKKEAGPVRIAALGNLTRIDADAEGVLPTVLKALEDKDARVRDAAVFALTYLGPKRQLAVSTLLKLLDHKNADIRDDAQTALFRMSQQALGRTAREDLVNRPGIKVPVDRFIPWLHEADNNKFFLAIGLLSLQGAEAKAAVPELIKVLRKNPKRCDAAANALGRIGPAAHAAVPELLRHLDDDVLGADAWALGEIGAQADKVVPALLEALEKPNARARDIMDAIVRFRQAAVPAVSAKLKSDKAATRANAIQILALLGAETAVPRIEGLLKDPDPLVRLKAARALWHLDRDAKRALPVLEEALSHKDPALRRRAIVYLGVIGPDAKPAAAKLKKLLADSDVKLRVAAAEALWKIEGQADMVLPVFIAGLKDAEVAREAVRGLMRMGPAARPAIPALHQVERGWRESNGALTIFEAVNAIEPTLSVRLWPTLFNR